MSSLISALNQIGSIVALIQRPLKEHATKSSNKRKRKFDNQQMELPRGILTMSNSAAKNHNDSKIPAPTEGSTITEVSTPPPSKKGCHPFDPHPTALKNEDLSTDKQCFIPAAGVKFNVSHQALPLSDGSPLVKLNSAEENFIGPTTTTVISTRQNRNQGAEVKIEKCCKTDFKISKCTTPLNSLPLPVALPENNSGFAQTDCGNSPKPPSSVGSVTSGSRFKIVNVEKRYKRGRWDVFEFTSENTIPNTPNNDLVQQEKKSRAQLQRVSTVEMIQQLGRLTNENLPSTAYPSTSPLSSVENSQFLEFVGEPTSNIGNFGGTLSNGSNDDSDMISSTKNALGLNGAVVPSVVRRHSLAPGSLSSSPSKPSSQVKLYRNKSQLNKCVNGSTSIYNQSMLHDIDRKIEQAMDLVKTHLMFAVREEMEVLQSRIIELEAQIFQLEMENTILKKHVSAEVIESLEHSKTRAQ